MITSNHIMLITAAGFSSVVFAIATGAPLTLWLYSLLMYFLFSCLGITITFHRHLTHNSFKFKWQWLRFLCIIFGSIAGTGSALGWVAVHRTHHKLSDKEGDPHGPITGWRNFFNDYDDDVNYMMVRDLLKDPVIDFLHRNGLYVLLLYYAIIFALGGIYGLVFFGFIPQMLTIFISGMCNYFAHMTGYQTFDTKDDSKNTWWLAIPTWGDSWHNNHHAMPHKYSFTNHWWEIDISGLIIRMIKE